MKSSVLHPDLRNEHYVDWIRFLRNSEYWSLEQIEQYQLSELKRIVRHAYHNTRGYREMCDSAGVAPDTIQTLEDFRRLPFIEKETIRDRLEEFSASFENRSYVTTGGSTGIPFGMYRDPEAFPKELASKAYQYYRVGWQEGDRQLVLRGLPIDTPDHMVFIPEFNELRCSSFHLVPEWMEVYRQRALDYQPEWIKCYPSSGYIFARWLKHTGRPFPRVKGILCASENLYDFQKDLMTQVFGARMFSHYGHYELAVLAGFCEYADTYHVLPQYGYAELIGPDGRSVTEPGQMGEIVATSFIMQATPFIRYRTRDFAVLKGWLCPECGRAQQIWGRIEGRLQEFILTGTGRLISMTSINFHDDIFDHMRQFQFYQEAKGQVTFRYVPKNTCNDAALENIRRRLLMKLGQDVELSMQPVDDIPLTSRGKYCFLIQKLKIAFHDA